MDSLPIEIPAPLSVMANAKIGLTIVTIPPISINNPSTLIPVSTFITDTNPGIIFVTIPTSSVACPPTLIPASTIIPDTDTAVLSPLSMEDTPTVFTSTITPDTETAVIFVANPPLSYIERPPTVLPQPSIISTVLSTSDPTPEVHLESPIGSVHVSG